MSRAVKHAAPSYDARVAWCIRCNGPQQADEQGCIRCRWRCLQCGEIRPVMATVEVNTQPERGQLKAIRSALECSVCWLARTREIAS